MTPLRLKSALLAISIVISSSTLAAAFDTTPVNTKITDGVMQIGKHQYPLPPGEWTLIAKSSRNVVNQVEFTRGSEVQSAYLISTKGTQFRAAISIVATTGSSNITDWLLEPCKRTNVIFKESAGSFKIPDCLLLSHDVALLKPGTTWMNEAALWAEKNSIRMPVTTLTALLDKYVLGEYVVSRVWINPELAGQTPSAKTAWLENDWHKDRVQSFPEKYAYATKFFEWAKGFRIAYSEALDDGKSARLLAEIPDLAK